MMVAERNFQVRLFDEITAAVYSVMLPCNRVLFTNKAPCFTQSERALNGIFTIKFITIIACQHMTFLHFYIMYFIVSCLLIMSVSSQSNARGRVLTKPSQWYILS